MYFLSHFLDKTKSRLLLNYARISINKTLSQAPNAEGVRTYPSWANYIQILQFSPETEFTPLILAPTGMATR